MLFTLKKVLFSIGALSVISLCLVSGFAMAADKIGDVGPTGSDGSSVKIIEPKKDVSFAKAAAIDNERFELGLYAGYLTVEEFNSNPVLGVSFSYHVIPQFMLQANYGESEVDRATFEENALGDFVREDERTFKYSNVLAGYRALRGRSFFGRNSKYNSDIYLLAGFGRVSFAGDANTSFVIGSSYRVVLTDSLTVNFDFRGHSVERDFLNENKRTFNSELALGVNFLF